jgi:pyruvate/2-oxoglutarate dehydrogenase complex dihydrolipoamide dehydrogenase (E3) component
MNWHARFYEIYFRFRSSRRAFKSAFAPAGKNPVQAASHAIDPKQKIVVVGLGISAITLVDQLYQNGFRNVHIVADILKFGGKCVHFGCMPSEAFWRNPNSVAASIEQLADLSEEKCRGWGLPIHQATVQNISGKTVNLNSGEALNFDILILAIGNRMVPPVGLSPNLKPEDFWKLNANRRLIIVSEGEPSAWSYADMARAMGAACTLIETKNSASNDLPSLKYFRRQIIQKGIRHFSEARLVSFEKNKIGIRASGAFHEIPYDDLLYVGPAQLQIPLVDGNVQDIFSINLETSSLKRRSDIFALGDAGGFLTATEAELKALKLAWQLSGRQHDISLEHLSQLPLRLHAEQSWAAVGRPINYLAPNWKEIDFMNLGWSLLHSAGGKLWYLFNPASQKIEALHICHIQASELISMAAVLLDKPVTDSAWLTSSVHPSAAEIFKFLVLQLRSDYPELFRSHKSGKTILKLPAFSELRTRFEIFFSEKEFRSAQIESDPWLHLALLIMRKHTGIQNKEFAYEYDSNSGVIEAKIAGHRYEIQRG